MGHLLWSLKQIRMRLFESILIIIAIGLGVGALCSVAALLLAFNDTTARQLSEYRLITIRPSTRDRGGLYSLSSDSSPVKLLGRVDDEEITLTLDDMYALATEVPEIKYAFVVQSASLTLADAGPRPSVDYRTREGQARMAEWERANSVYTYFTFPAAFDAQGMQLHFGSLFLQSDIDEGRLVGVVGWDLAKRVFGNSDPVGQQLRLQVGNAPVTVTVIGVFKELKAEVAGVGYSSVFGQSVSRLNDGLFMPYTSFDTMYRSMRRTFYGGAFGTSINEILAMPADNVDPGTALAKVRSYVSTRYGLGLSVSSPIETFRAAAESSRSVAIVIGAFGSVALVIAAINSLNLMIARVLRRTKSFGISAALGLSRPGIFAQFMTECFVVSLIGALIGMGLSVAFTQVFSATVLSGEIAIGVPVEVWLIGIGVAVLCTLVFGLYPALQASRVDVVDALRTA